VAWSHALRKPLVTTDYIVLEVGNTLTRGPDRALFIEFIKLLHADPRTEVVPATADWLMDGIDLFAARTDQTWSLTDCLSFVLMTARGLTDALTSDHHFEQAGFRALLRSPVDQP
jgi:predicted nucleic acid-binding protein